MNSRPRVSIQAGFSLLCCLSLTLVSGCALRERMILGSPERKGAASETYQSDWHSEESPFRYGSSRAAQVFGQAVRTATGGISFGSSSALVTLVSADGYALTANHVLDGMPSIDTPRFLRMAENRAIPVNIQRITFRSNADTNVVEERIALFRYSEEPKWILSAEDVQLSSLRVVKQFPKDDIAVVKLDGITEQWFEIDNVTVSIGTPVFTSGNVIASDPSASAGRIESISDERTPAIEYHTTMPVRRGDSGGPVFDADGRLVGIASAASTSWRFERFSRVKMLNPGLLQTIIQEDRASRVNSEVGTTDSSADPGG